jgi:BclB C-terminal domain-containing protein
MAAYGTSAVITPSLGSIDLTTSPQLAYSMPRDGTITDITGFVSISAPLNLVGTTITLTIELFSSTSPDNIFTAIPGALTVVAPALTGIISVGTFANGITTGLSIPVTAQTRLLFVISATAAGVTLINNIDLYFSGGVNIV